MSLRRHEILRIGLGLAAAAMLFAVPNGGAHAADDAAQFKNPLKRQTITPYIRWFVAEDPAMEVEAARDRFERGDAETGAGEWFELGYMDATVWIAAKIQNLTPENRLVLEFRNPRTSYVDLYVPDGTGGFTMLPNGSARPFSVRAIQHPMPAFPITLHEGESTTVYVRLQNVGDFRARLWLWGADAFRNRIASAYYPEMVTIGVLLVLAVYQFLIFLSLREPGYLHLSLFIVTWLLFFMAGNGTGHMLLWSDFPWLALRANTIFLVPMCASFVLFTMSFLETRRYTPRLYAAGCAFVALCLVDLVYAGLTNSLLQMQINRYLGLGALLLVGALVFQAVRAGNRLALFFLVSWIFVIIGALLVLLLTWYLVSANWVMGTPLVAVLFTTSILLWSFELTGRIKVRAAEQRRILEEQVRERTHELEKALGDVKTLSGLLPICSSCKKIRDDSGYWNSVEGYIARHTDAGFTHGICPDCCDKLYPELADRIRQDIAAEKEASARASG